ncbi:uncharacterized protein [Clytia hemisphaerica]|uniref:Uncharacterized protein n=1 Tax=Clytia hemisphaerica TaxID=252671 RepID=A0A7M5URR1_9CNID
MKMNMFQTKMNAKRLLCYAISVVLKFTNAVVDIEIGHGEDIQMTWNIPPTANNLFIYLGSQRDAPVLAHISKGEIAYSKKLTEARFGTRLFIQMVDSDLKLTIVDAQDSDEETYTATAQFGIGEVKILQSFRVEVTAQSSHDKSISLGSGLSSTDTGIIVGIVVAIVVLIVVLILIRYCYDRNYNPADHLTDPEKDSETHI